jgi:hypothetical protein
MKPKTKIKHLREWMRENYGQEIWNAAAPDMLKALEVAYEIINYAGDFINAYDMCDAEMEDYINPRIDIVTNAIKKARGE